MKRDAFGSLYARVQSQREGLLLCAASAGVALAAAAIGLILSEENLVAITTAVIFGLIAAGILAYLLIRPGSTPAPTAEVDPQPAELVTPTHVAEGLALLGSWSYEVDAEKFIWSEGAYRLFGADPSTPPPTPRDFLSSIHPDDQERWQTAHRRAIKSAREIRIEYRYLKPEGDMIWVRSVAVPGNDASGATQRLSGIVQDVSTMRNMARLLAAS